MELAFLNIGTQEMVLILVVALLLFGGKKLPELARGLGKGIREFKDASEGIKKEIADQINNFEKDLDVTDETPAKPSYNTNTQTVADTTPESLPVEGETLAAEKKFPDFSAPANTYQHDPGAHPVDESEYYKYGYSDHFATENSDEVTPSDDAADKSESAESETTDQSRNA